MADEFTPITTQEQLDTVIKDRINRLNDKHARELNEAIAKYSDYEDLKQASADSAKVLKERDALIEELTGKVSNSESKLKELEKENGEYKVKTMKQVIAIDAGIPIQFADRLTGTTEEELKADAESLKSLFVKPASAPLADSSAASPDNGVMAAFRKMNPNIKL